MVRLATRKLFFTSHCQMDNFPKRFTSPCELRSKCIEKIPHDFVFRPLKFALTNFIFAAKAPIIYTLLL